MKKLFVILSLLIISAGTVFAAEEKSPKDAFREMAESNREFNVTCSNVAGNFRVDHMFSGYIRSRCLLYESDRQRMIDVIFPISSSSSSEYKQNYPIIKSEFVVSSNKKEIENIKTIVTEYCKHNAFRFTKKAPEACTSEQIGKLFAND